MWNDLFSSFGKDLKSRPVVLAVNDHVLFYSSSDLKNWKVTGEFGRKDGSHSGVWECPTCFR
jgi:fructan beta-fructosidase